MSDRLYVIGNGFDLHHGLATGYYDFARFLKKENSDLYNTLESYISYPVSDQDLWSKFEENLANLDVDEILSEHSDRLPNYASDDFRDRDRYVFPDIMEEQYEKLTTGLVEVFRRFILAVTVPASAHERKVNLDKSAYFLTFNYTDTLERLYKIDRKNILYIHNSAYYNDEIVLGHGIDPRTFKEEKPMPPDGLDGEELEKWYEQHDDFEYSYDTGKETLMKYFEATFKPTEKIISRHCKYFKSLRSVDEVNILGHSISSVDLPYFEHLVKSVSDTAKWNVSYYNAFERKRHLQTLEHLGINSNKIEQFELKDILENNRQLKLDF